MDYIQDITTPGCIGDWTWSCAVFTGSIRIIAVLVLGLTENAVHETAGHHRRIYGNLQFSHTEDNDKNSGSEAIQNACNE